MLEQIFSRKPVIQELPEDFDIWAIDDEDIVKPKVDILVCDIVREKYKTGWINQVRKKPAEQIIIHATGGGNSIAGMVKWMWDGERAENYYRGVSLFNYLIGYRGEIVEIIHPDYYLKQSHSGGHAKKEISIEVMNSSKSNRDHFKTEQYNALFNLIFEYLMPKYPSINDISSHRSNIVRFNRSRGLKQCPGVNFNWNLLNQKLQEYGYSFESLRQDSKINIIKV